MCHFEACPQCCHAYVLKNFGAGHSGESDEYKDFFKHPRVKRDSAEAIKKYLDDNIPGCRLSGIQVIFACPTNHQPEAIKALEEYGFFGAPEKDLLASAQKDTYYHYKDDGWRVDKSKPAFTQDHYMVPMFYLIPVDGKKAEFDDEDLD